MYMLAFGTAITEKNGSYVRRYRTNTLVFWFSLQIQNTRKHHLQKESTHHLWSVTANTAQSEARMEAAFLCGRPLWGSQALAGSRDNTPTSGWCSLQSLLGADSPTGCRTKVVKKRAKPNYYLWMNGRLKDQKEECFQQLKRTVVLSTFDILFSWLRQVNNSGKILKSSGEKPASACQLRQNSV